MKKKFSSACKNSYSNAYECSIITELVLKISVRIKLDIYSTYYFLSFFIKALKDANSSFPIFSLLTESTKLTIESLCTFFTKSDVANSK
uniref:Uncharacterized protein n=1 Tax=Clostridioides difficile TaxID=1496 RepID=Q6V592_CLODI|nr:unknown [Clostridioides difficile]